MPYTSGVELELTTPALLFPAISLLLLAYTSRFLSLANLIRHLSDCFRESGATVLVAQIDNLRQRIRLIRAMQALGVLSFFLCVLCMLLLFLSQVVTAKVVFAASLLLLMGSLAMSVREIAISTRALNLSLEQLEHPDAPRRASPS